MRPEIFRKYRLLFIKQGCRYCRMYLEFIERINMKLPINKRIRIIDCTLYGYGIVSDPLILLFEKYIKGYPFLAIDGNFIDGINTNLETQTFLKAYLDEEFINHESNEFMFVKNCEYQTKGMFKHKIVCKED